MRKDVYLFRHGETDANKEGRSQGCGIDLFLNETGVVQASAMIEKFTDKNLEVIFSSPLKRAKHTAAIIADGLKIPVKIKAGFRESCFGVAEGMYNTEIDRTFSEIFVRWKSFEPEDLDVCFPDGETKREIQVRMLNALNELLDEDYSVIGVATHGSAMRNLLFCLGLNNQKIGNGAIFHLIYEDGKWTVEKKEEENA